MPADLAGGYTGPALFLAQLAALTGAGHYAEVARTALAPVPGLLDALRARPADLCAVGSGAFSGLGGIAYALAETARLLDDPEVGSWAFAMLRLAGEAALSEREHGVGAGVAGGLVALLAAHRAGAGDEGQEIWRDAQACADRLAAVDPTAGGRGFTTGAAGLGWALLRFAEAEATAGSGGGAAGGGERYRLAGLSALRAAVGGEPDARPGPGDHGELPCAHRPTGPRTRPGPRPGAGGAPASRSRCWTRRAPWTTRTSRPGPAGPSKGWAGTGRLPTTACATARPDCANSWATARSRKYARTGSAGPEHSSRPSRRPVPAAAPRTGSRIPAC